MKYRILGSVLVIVVLIVLYMLFASGGSAPVEDVSPFQP